MMGRVVVDELFGSMPTTLNDTVHMKCIDNHLSG
jgi:hypothetical protein